jgi:predicted RND superfamily exporter protein
MHLSIREMADPALPSARWSAEEERSFGAERQLQLLFVAREPRERLEADDLVAIRRWLEVERARNPEILRITSPFDVLRAQRENGRLRLVPALDSPTPEGLRALAAGSWGGLLTDREGRDVVADLALRDTPGGSRFGRFDPAAVAAIERRCRDELLSARPGVELFLTGAAAFDHFAAAGLERFRSLNMLVLVLMLGAVRLLFGTWRCGLLLGGVVAFAGAVIYGAMALTGVAVDLLSTGLFLMLAVAAVEDFVFIAHERLVHGTAWRGAFRRLLVPGFLTSLTTVVGFGSLCVSDLSLVRRFGFWGALGAALEWAATFLVLPALLQVVPALRMWTVPSRALGARRWTRLATWRLRPGFAAVLLLVLGGALFASLHLEYGDAPAQMFPSGHPFRRALAYAEASRGWVGQLDVVFPEDAAMSDVDRVAVALRSDPAVSRVVDPASLLRSLTGDDPLAGFELVAERGALQRASGALMAPDGRLRASVFLRKADLETLHGLRDRIVARFPDGDGFPAGELVTYAEVGGAVPRTLMSSLLTCLALVGLVIGLLFRALGRSGGLRAIAASFWGPAAMLVAMAALRVPVNFVSVSFASVLVGLTGDNAVQFAWAASRRELGSGIDRRAGAAVLVAVVMGLCALTFVGSAFLPPRRLGVLLAGGLAAALLGDVLILGGLAGASGAGAPRR